MKPLYLADDDQIDVRQSADADVLRPQCSGVNGRDRRRVGQAPGKAGQRMGVEQMGVDDVDAALTDQLDRHLDRTPGRIVLNGRDVNLEPEPAQRCRKRALVGA